MLKKQLAFIITGVLLIALLLGLYFFTPLFNKGENPDEPNNGFGVTEGEDGEYIHANGRAFLYQPQDRKNIESVTVENKTGSYTLIHAEDEDAFYVSGHENLTLNEEAVSNIVVAARYPLSTEKITEPGKLSDYGLETPSAKVSMKTKDGESFSFILGDLIPTGAGYYAAVEGRNRVYLMDDDYSVLLNSVNSLFSVAFAPSIQDPTLIDNITLYKNGELFIKIRTMTQEETEQDLTVNRYTVEVPAGGVVSSESLSKILDVITTLTADNIISAAADPDTLAEYSLDKPEYVFSYTYNGELYEYRACAAEGGYNVYSPTFGVIAYVDAAAFDFLSWDRDTFITRRIFEISIDEIASLEITGESGTRALFNLTHKDGNLVVTDSEKGVMDTSSFRQLYMGMLKITLQDITKDEPLSSKFASFKITVLDGRTFEYNFYTLTSRTCRYSADGKMSDYYVSKDAVAKVLNDVLRLQRGEAVSADSLS